MGGSIRAVQRLRRSRVALIAATVLLGAGLALSGCAATQGAPTLDKAAKVTLTWWTGQTSKPQAALEALAADFTKEHQNVTINVSSGASTTDKLLEKLTAAFATTKYPDIAYAFGNWTGKLAASGKTLNLTEAMSKPEAKWDEFPAAARETSTPDGKIIGVPALVGNLSLVYNPKLFDKAGIGYPTASWTWADFRAAAKALTDPSTQTFGTALQISGGETTTWQLWPQLWQLGGEIVDKQGNATFNSEAGVTSLATWQQMAVADKSVFIDQTDMKADPLFADGKLGMMITGPWSLQTYVEAGVPYGVQILPGTNGDHQTVSGADVWVAFDHNDANRAYWTGEFLTWLSSAQIDPRWTMSQGNLPLRPSEEQTDAFKQLVDKFPGVEVMSKNMANAKQARPTTDSYVVLSRFVGEAIAEAVQGVKTPREALDHAAEEYAAARQK